VMSLVLAHAEHRHNANIGPSNPDRIGLVVLFEDANMRTILFASLV
jgi:hypothetical protein